MSDKIIDLKKIRTDNFYKGVIKDIDDEINSFLRFALGYIDPHDEVFELDELFSDDLKMYVWSNEQFMVSAAVLCDKNCPKKLSLASMQKICDDVEFTISGRTRLLLV